MRRTISETVCQQHAVGQFIHSISSGGIPFLPADFFTVVIKLQSDLALYRYGFPIRCLEYRLRQPLVRRTHLLASSSLSFPS